MSSYYQLSEKNVQEHQLGFWGEIILDGRAYFLVRMFENIKGTTEMFLIDKDKKDFSGILLSPPPPDSTI